MQGNRWGQGQPRWRTKLKALRLSSGSALDAVVMSSNFHLSVMAVAVAVGVPLFVGAVLALHRTQNYSALFAE